MFSYQSAQSFENEDQSDSRRNEIIRVTESIIAQKGFEGLRIRDIAEHIGVNNGTIHYYFKTKDKLIQAVVESVIHQVISTHNPGRQFDPMTPCEELEAYFDDMCYQFEHFQDRFTVFDEIYMRAARDEAIHNVLLQFDEQWLKFLNDILQRGIETEEFRADLDLSVTSHHIMMLFKGTQLQLKKRHSILVSATQQIIEYIKRQ